MELSTPTRQLTLRDLTRLRTGVVSIGQTDDDDIFRPFFSHITRHPLSLPDYTTARQDEKGITFDQIDNMSISFSPESEAGTLPITAGYIPDERYTLDTWIGRQQQQQKTSLLSLFLQQRVSGVCFNTATVS